MRFNAKPQKKALQCQVCFYREDAKGRAAKSVRDRLTALLRSGLSTASVVATPKTRGYVALFVTQGLHPRKANASAKCEIPRVAEIMLAANAVNHKSSEASATTHFQLQAKRTWNLQLRHRRFGTYPCSVSERLQRTFNIQQRTFNR